MGSGFTKMDPLLELKSNKSLKSRLSCKLYFVLHPNISRRDSSTEIYTSIKGQLMS